MTVLSKAGIDEQVFAPSLAPADDPIDVDHLARMTLGDRSLEREVLQLFDRQVDMLMARLTGGDPSAVTGAAHTLKGSAQGIGARNVALAAAAVERAAEDDAARRYAVDALRAALVQARAAIAELLRAG
jgi:HPt (histidine-containing phosphotransfer) domain-containing protein